MAELPKQYKACVYDSPGSVSTKVEMLDMPEPSTGEVLINLYAKPSTHAYIYFSMKLLIAPACLGPILAFAIPITAL